MLKQIFIVFTLMLIILSCEKDKIKKEQTNGDKEIKVSINIDDDEKDVSISREIVIDFSDKVLKLDGSEINDKNMGEILSFREEDSKGKEVQFSLNIANDKKQITIQPNVLNKSTKYYFQIDGKKLKGAKGEKVIGKKIVFTTRTDDSKDISVSINIKNDDKNVSISKDIVIDFSDKVLKLDGSEVDDKNIKEVLSFKQGDNKGKEVVFNLNIANDKKQITIKPNVLKKSTKYYFRIDGSKLKGENGEKILSKEIVFTTEAGFIGPLNITDPLYKDQWHLKNTGQFAGYKAGVDINIEPVWKKGYNGSNISVGIFDDLVDGSHPDLKDNISSANIVNYATGVDKCKNNHGTNVAGVIAARDNNIGVIGIAYRSKLYSYGVLGSKSVNLIDMIARGLKRKESSQIAVYNFSLGNASAEWVYFKITDKEKQAMDLITQNGFGGLGSSLVFSAGNFGLSGVSTNTSFLNHHATINVNSFDGNGFHAPAFASTKGQNIWIAGPTRKITTTDNAGKCGENDGDYVNDFSGTSAASPMVTGVIALIRQANPSLTYRDVKLVLAESANKNNGAKYLVSGKMYSDPSKDQSYSEHSGFGFLDANKAIDLATNWTNLPKERKVYKASSDALIDVSTLNKEHQTKIKITNSNINFIESVIIEIKLEKAQPVELIGHILKLISPDNKVSQFYKKSFSYQMHFKENYSSIILMSNAFLGSSTIDGEWTLSLEQRDEYKDKQKIIKKIKSWNITIRGHYR